MVISITDIYFDNSQLADYRRCPRLYLLRHHYDLVPVKKSMPLYFGEYMHRALSKWYETGSVEQSMSVWDDYEDEQWDEKRTAVRGMEILEGYIDKYPEESWDLLANEIYFEKELFQTPSGTFYLLGRIDLAVEWNGFIYGVDHKTTSRLGKSYFYQFKKNFQMMGYTLALGDRYEMTQGMLINALAVYKSNLKYERHLASYTPKDLEEYKRVVRPLMQEVHIAKATWNRNSLALTDEPELRDAIFRPDFDRCQDWGRCDYGPVCNSGFSENVLSNGYKKEPWDPREEAV